MYDPQQVLMAIDQHKRGILALCGLAMICNYTWFFAAVRQGFRDRVFPIPIFCTYFWLAGDGSMVLRYNEWFHVYDHWYLKLFWLALCFTVLCELVFLYMTLRFGKDELAPNWSQAQFNVVILSGFIVTAVTWSFVKAHMGDDLYISYFHLANMAGPPFAAALLIRRRSRAGTSTLIWSAYTLMVASWFTACDLWFGPPFDSTIFVLFYIVCTLAAAGMIVAVRRAPDFTAIGAPAIGAPAFGAQTSNRSPA
jgi:hypothetical protein